MDNVLAEKGGYHAESKEIFVAGDCGTCLAVGWHQYFANLSEVAWDSDAAGTYGESRMAAVGGVGGFGRLLLYVS